MEDLYEDYPYDFAAEQQAEVDDILERWLAGEDVSEWEDDGTIAEIKEDADELE